MSRNVWILLSLLVVSSVAIFWYQFHFYRTPVSATLGDQSLEIVLATAHKDDIPAINEPAFESVGSADLYLDDAGFGILVTVGSRVRFYPFQVLAWHEVVNDLINGRDLLVTYDPLTFTSAVYEREDTFGVSGKVWNSNTLLYDASTESLWSQLRGEAIQGPMMGTRLERYPAEVVTWSVFKETYPFGLVLSPNTGFDRDYTQDPYEGYAQSQAIWFPLDAEDARLPSKSLVFGVSTGESDMAFPVDSVEEFGIIQAIVGEDEVLVPSYWFSWSAMYPGTQIYSALP